MAWHQNAIDAMKKDSSSRQADVDVNDIVENPWNIHAEQVPISLLRLQNPQKVELKLATEHPPMLLPASASDPEELLKGRSSAEVLGQFDPLLNDVELNASEARPSWFQPKASSEAGDSPGLGSLKAHRPPTPCKPLTDRTAAAPSALPSLASFAKSFSLSSRTQSRPFDTKTEPSLLSPITISSLGTQQSRRSINIYNGQTAPNTQEQIELAGAVCGSSSTGDETVVTFDFQRFLDQMKSRSAEPVAKYLRSFLANFSKRSLTVNEQIKVVNEFLSFIADKMREIDTWRSATDAEFDMAVEAMEKLVMNRLYEYTFTPQLKESCPPRRITTDDLERDRVLEQRVALFGWIEEKHLDLPECSESRGFILFAQQELLKINHYKAPRDKLICILNCCKVIFGLIRHLQQEENADSFVPILIYVVLQANPPHLISNIEYINRFRNPERLQSEAGYYLSSLMGAVSFVETLDHSTLSHITADEFERNVEIAISNLPCSPLSQVKSPISDIMQISQKTSQSSSSTVPLSSSHAGEESAQPLSLSLGNGLSGLSLAEDSTRRFLQRTGDTLSKPLTALGRMLGEVMDGLDREPSASTSGSHIGVESDVPDPFAPSEAAKNCEHVRIHDTEIQSFPIPPIRGSEATLSRSEDFQAPYKTRVRNLHGSGLSTPMTPISGRSGRSTPDSTLSSTRDSYKDPALNLPPHFLRPSSLTCGLETSRSSSPGLDIAGLQAEIDQAHERAASEALGSLSQMFPMADREVLEWVLEAERGDLGRSIEKMLELS